MRNPLYDLAQDGGSTGGAFMANTGNDLLSQLLGSPFGVLGQMARVKTNPMILNATPGINPVQSDPVADLMRVLSGNQTEAQRIREQALQLSPQQQGLLPRPGAMALAALADMLFNKGKGNVFNSFTQGHAAARNDLNQKATEEARRKQALMLEQARGIEGQNDLATTEFNLRRQRESEAMRQRERMDDRAYNEQKYKEQLEGQNLRNREDNERMMAQENERNMRAAVGAFNATVSKLRVENGGIPDAAYAEIKAEEARLRALYPKAAGIDTVTRGDTLKGKKTKAEIDNIRKGIADREKNTAARLAKWTADIERDKQRTTIQQQNANTARMGVGVSARNATTAEGNLGMRKEEFEWRKKNPQGVSQLDKLETDIDLDLAAQQRVVNLMAANDELETDEYKKEARKLAQIKARKSQIQKLRLPGDTNGYKAQPPVQTVKPFNPMEGAILSPALPPGVKVRRVR